MSTRGAYPVSPTARNLPSLLSATHVAAFMRSLLVHVLEVSELSLKPYPDSLSETRPLLSFAFGADEGAVGECDGAEAPCIGWAVGRAR